MKEIDKTKFNKMVERNLKGIELEKEGKVHEAIILYEQNIEEGFDGNHPYDRLAVLYNRKKQYQDEYRVMVRAVYVFTELSRSTQRSDVNPKLEKFIARRDKVKKLIDKYNI